MIRKGYPSERLVISPLEAYRVSTLRFEESGIYTSLQSKESMSENHSSTSGLTNCALHRSLHTCTVIVCVDSPGSGIRAVSFLSNVCCTVRLSSDNCTCNRAISGDSLWERKLLSESINIHLLSNSKPRSVTFADRTDIPLRDLIG